MAEGLHGRVGHSADEVVASIIERSSVSEIGGHLRMSAFPFPDRIDVIISAFQGQMVNADAETEEHSGFRS